MQPNHVRRPDPPNTAATMPQPTTTWSAAPTLKRHAVTTGVFYDKAYAEYTANRPCNDATSSADGKTVAGELSPSTFCRWHQMNDAAHDVEIEGTVYSFPPAPKVATYDADHSESSDFQIPAQGISGYTPWPPLRKPEPPRQHGQPVLARGRVAMTLSYTYLCTGHVNIEHGDAANRPTPEQVTDYCVQYPTGPSDMAQPPRPAVKTAQECASEYVEHKAHWRCLGGGSLTTLEYTVNFWFAPPESTTTLALCNGSAAAPILATSNMCGGGQGGTFSITDDTDPAALKNSRYACRCDNAQTKKTPNPEAGDTKAKNTPQPQALSMGHDGAVFYKQCCNSEYATTADIPTEAGPFDSAGTAKQLPHTPNPLYQRPQWRPHLDGYPNLYGGTGTSMCAIGAAGFHASTGPWRPLSGANMRPRSPPPTTPARVRQRCADQIQRHRICVPSCVVRRFARRRPGRHPPPLWRAAVCDREDCAAVRLEADVRPQRHCRLQDPRPPVFQQAGASSIPPVPDDYTGRPYFAEVNSPLPQPCNCRSATPCTPASRSRPPTARRPATATAPAPALPDRPASSAAGRGRSAATRPLLIGCT